MSSVYLEISVTISLNEGLFSGCLPQHFIIKEYLERERYIIIIERGLDKYHESRVNKISSALTSRQGKLHSVACSISVLCRASERVVEGPLQDKESFLH